MEHQIKTILKQKGMTQKELAEADATPRRWPSMSVSQRNLT